MEIMKGAKGIGISGSLIWSKTLMEHLFDPCGEFRWSPEGPVSQIHSSHRQVGAPGTFRSFKVHSDAKERMWCGKQREATAPIQSLVKLQPWFLSLRWKTYLRQNCSLGSCICNERPALVQNTWMMMMMMMMNVVFFMPNTWRWSHSLSCTPILFIDGFIQEGWTSCEVVVVIFFI